MKAEEQMKAEDRITNLKQQFNDLELSLRYFKNGSKRDRFFFQEAFANGNMGYISSLMAMLTDEDKFQRWLGFTAWKFRKFK